MKRDTHDSLVDKIHAFVRDVLDDGPFEKERSFLSLSSEIILKPQQFAQITARPQLPFRGDRLAVWGGNATSFLINGLRVGTRALGAQAGDVPADAFATRLDLLPVLDAQLAKDGFWQVRLSRKAEECFGQPITMPRADVGSDIVLTVTNIGETDQPFRAVLFGDVEWRDVPSA